MQAEEDARKLIAKWVRDAVDEGTDFENNLHANLTTVLYYLNNLEQDVRITSVPQYHTCSICRRRHKNDDRHPCE